MRVVDGHVHVGGWVVEGFAGRQTALADAVSLFRRLGFDGALVTTTDRGDNDALRGALRAQAAADAGGSALALRLAWWVDPGSPDAVRQLETALPDVAALKIHPSFLRRPLSDEGFAPFLDLAAAAGLPVVVHCGRWQEVAGYGVALAVAERRRNVSIVLSHMGGDEPLLVRGAVREIRERSLANVWLGTESLRQYWIVQEAVDALGAARIIFGSDYNLNHPAAFLAIVEALDLSEVDRARILAGNLNALVPPGLRFY